MRPFWKIVTGISLKWPFGINVTFRNAVVDLCEGVISKSMLHMFWGRRLSHMNVVCFYIWSLFFPFLEIKWILVLQPTFFLHPFSRQQFFVVIYYKTSHCFYRISAIVVSKNAIVGYSNDLKTYDSIRWMILYNCRWMLTTATFAF